MTKIKVSSAISRPPKEFVSTTADTKSPISRQTIDEEAWQKLLDQLIEWAENPKCVADEGVEPPNRDAVAIAGKMLVELKANGAGCPQRIVPDPNGGLVIEYDGTPEHQYHIWDDGSVDLCVFEGTKLRRRMTL